MDAGIKVRNKKEKSLIYIPNVISPDPLDKLYSATEWLVGEAVDDYNNTHKKIDARRKKEGYSQKNVDDLNDLGIRIGSRTQSYVNQLCLMEDLLTFEYKRMCQFLKVASSGKIAFKAKSDIQYLLDQMEPIRRFRNKVVAHTAYTNPLVDKKTGLPVDNPETVVRSILNLFPAKGDIKLGNNYYSGFSKWGSELPIITIYSWEEHAKLVLNDWKKLFISKMIEVHKRCPIDNKNYSIEIAYPHKAKQIRELYKDLEFH